MTHIKKIYLRKKIYLSNTPNYLILTKKRVKLKTFLDKQICTPFYTLPYFNFIILGDSLIKVPLHTNNQIKEQLNNHQVNNIALFYNKKWYTGSCLKKENFNKINNKIISLLIKLRIQKEKNNF